MSTPQKPAVKMPVLVRIIFWKVHSRQMALTWVRVLGALGLVCAFFSLMSPLNVYLWVPAIYSFAAGALCWWLLKWFDRNGVWPSATPSKGLIAAVWCIPALAALVLATLEFFIGIHHFSHNGMYPGLPAKSVIFTNKRAYAAPSDVKRGDIVYFTLETEEETFKFILRVIGLPGETVKNAGEALSINGQPVKRKLLRKADDTTIFRESIGEASYEVAFDKTPPRKPLDVTITVPADAFFVMADNRLSAFDSRWFGTVPFSAIIGKKF
ncbi:MAG: signal peptidase I [Alphaproteobacteria bacterium]